MKKVLIKLRKKPVEPKRLIIDRKYDLSEGDNLDNIIGVAMDKAGITEVKSNFGDTFTLEDVKSGKLEVNEK